ncbi:pilus assembly protein PilP [Persicimonas caeni]|uniref:Pilus assembly protein PilP n=1 Tax=Persicimonas caeni TaxID=2292766 RepID=A0A4Y6PX59_PERCE|nr:pilus assembly protein PilP [Persicimonas caeni]QED34140.1 pilus assembly protein PilP [Persicimonas caeni]
MDRKQVNTRSHNISSARATVVLLALLMLGTSGCEFLGLDGSGGQQAQNAQQAQNPGANQAAQQQAATASEKEEEEEYERPEYPDQVRRNPFLPDLEIFQPKEQLADGDVRPLEPLEKYGLGQLQLVAIISEVAVPKAMFLDPEGFGHVVKEGDRIGQNGGTIADIRDNEVEVREITDEEETQTRLTTLELANDELEVRQEEGLSDEEREALRRLLQTDEGRKAVQESFDRRAPGAAASERQQNTRRGGLPPRR